MIMRQIATIKERILVSIMQLIKITSQWSVCHFVTNLVRTTPQKLPPLQCGANSSNVYRNNQYQVQLCIPSTFYSSLIFCQNNGPLMIFMV